MTRTLGIAVAGLLALAAAAGCARKDTPTAAFQAWLGAVEACDTPRMKAGLTKTSVGQVETLVRQLKAFVPAERQESFDLLNELCKGYRKGSMEVLSEKVEGDRATLTLKSLDGRMEAPMIREEGAWKLDFASLMRQAVSASFGARPPAPATPPPAAAPAPEAPAEPAAPPSAAP